MPGQLDTGIDKMKGRVLMKRAISTSNEKCTSKRNFIKIEFTSYGPH